MWNVVPWQLYFSDVLIDWSDWMKSWDFIFTELFSPKLMWDWTSHENIILYTNQWVIILLKIPYLNEINTNGQLVVSWNHWLFHDTFNDHRPGKFTIFKSHVSMFFFEKNFFTVWMWKQNIPSRPVLTVNVTGRGARIMSNVQY